MIKAIIFDCFGVLTSDSWKEFVAGLPKEERSKASELNRAYGAGVLNQADFLQAIEDLTGHSSFHVRGLLDNETTKNKELLEYIAVLKPKYKIGLLSNIATNWVRDEFLDPDEQELFDVMVFSYEIGAAKPDNRMYEEIVTRLGVSPAECVFIDDSEGHCAAASDIGMHGIWYQDFEQMKAELEAILHNPEG